MSMNTCGQEWKGDAANKANKSGANENKERECHLRFWSQQGQTLRNLLRESRLKQWWTWTWPLSSAYNDIDTLHTTIRLHAAMQLKKIFELDLIYFFIDWSLDLQSLSFFVRACSIINRSNDRPFHEINLFDAETKQKKFRECNAQPTCC